VNRPEDPIEIRRAEPPDIPSIEALIRLSVHGLQSEDYSEAQRDGALGSVFGVDTRLILDGTYFVAEGTSTARGSTENEHAGAVPSRVIVACGGWSKRKTLFGGDHLGVNPGSVREDSLLDPRSDRAKIRAFFVHPDWARRGLGSRILDTCEKAAIEAGFTGFELGATLTGERLYTARGYTATDRREVPLSNGASLPVIRMTKDAKGARI